MAELRLAKVVAALPSQLAANTVYFVRVGAGFSIHVTNNSGTVVAYALNPDGGDPWSYIRLPANAAVNTTAFAAVAGMTFVAAPNTVYEVEAFGAYQAAANTTGMGLALDIPSGQVIGLNLVAASATAPGSAQQIADATTTAATAGVATANSNTPVFARWLIAIGATGGNVNLMLRSEIASSAVTLQGGLFVLKHRPIP